MLQENHAYLASRPRNYCSYYAHSLPLTQQGAQGWDIMVEETKASARTQAPVMHSLASLTTKGMLSGFLPPCIKKARNQ